MPLKIIEAQNEDNSSDESIQDPSSYMIVKDASSLRNEIC